VGSRRVDMKGLCARMKHDNGRVVAIAQRLQVDDIHQVKISGILQQRGRLLHCEHDAALYGGAQAGG
jgi:hypothetical protein